MWAAQRNEYPVTVKSGHSLSEIVLSPQEIRYTSIQKPDLMVVLFPEGLARIEGQLRHLTPQDTIFIQISLPPIETRAKTNFLDFKEASPFILKIETWVMMALARVLEETRIYPLVALQDAISMSPRFAEQNLAALQAGIAIKTQ